MSNFKKLPLNIKLETEKVLKQLVKSTKQITILNEASKKKPNQKILINSLSQLESKNSSEIENIITTKDLLFKANIDKKPPNQATKEVQDYASAMKKGVDLVKENNFITNRTILSIQELIEGNMAGFRTQGGTKIINTRTGEVVHEPPQGEREIKDLMSNLEKYINTKNDLDPLINMALIHHQFETIHPFYDGNGRTGRILNILYLLKEKVLDHPVLYLSEYILKNKNQYYSTLQGVRNGEWEEYLIYILKGVEETSIKTTKTINNIHQSMENSKEKIRQVITNKDVTKLVELLYSSPYVKIEDVEKKLNITRKTASNDLKKIIDTGLLKEIKYKNSKLFANIELNNIIHNKTDFKKANNKQISR